MESLVLILAIVLPVALVQGALWYWRRRPRRSRG